MMSETIRRLGVSGGVPVAGRLENLFLRLQADTVVKGFGLHYTSRERVVRPLLPQCAGPPEWVLEGWRNGRYVNSALFKSARPAISTAVACSVPPFACRIRGGIPRVIRSPVSLPLAILAKAPSMELLSDGTHLFSMRFIGSSSRRKVLRAQMESILMNESIIEAIAEQHPIGRFRPV